jgi:predicted nicotinamide N-methyase
VFASSPESRWLSHSVGDVSYRLLNLEHPSVDEVIMKEMSNGVQVYYDRRWSLTDFFAAWLLENREWMAGRKVLVLGAGVGLETVVLGMHAAQLYINDLAPVSLDLCMQQLEENGIYGTTLLPGYYETIEVPDVDLVVGCFLIYNRETRAAMTAFCERFSGPILLVNETLGDFRSFLNGLTRPANVLFSEGPARGVLLPVR